MEIEWTTELKKELIEFLSDYITEDKINAIEEVLAQRTRHITLVLEDIYQSHNASAVVRSCECFGIQDVHVIEHKYEYTMNPDVTRGSAKWVDIIRHREATSPTKSCLLDMKAKGYKVVATTLDTTKKLYPLHELPLDSPVAIVFGTEKLGISEEVKEQADYFMQVPMVGFTQSFNISVSAALTLYDLTTRLKESDKDWKLTEEEVIDLRMRWYKKTVNRGELMEKKFFELKTS